MIPIQDPEKVKKVGTFFEEIAETTKEYIHYWTTNTLFHWDFWLSWSFAIVPWILWVRYRKKESTGRLLFVGFFALIISSWFDFIGVELGLWYYSGLAIPTIPSYVPWDFCLIPVFIMFLLQIKPHASALMKAVIFAVASAFIAEPLFLWLGFYRMVKWHLWWSFPIFIVIYLICNRLSKMKRFDEL
ncbi:CBO0543 family protein [Paenibacillus cremeus]|uniref:Uncharacterized protein n=1 Tax=Paenibacillus cremeus TaxID=2163881 RepID=A0A559K5I8_9BACL|nr:CBO0543 family protein [Paenibacillus cremeus]TVY07363.1 hypothetical protein FPZ49_24275 [Paenibacillus cremeus]